MAGIRSKIKNVQDKVQIYLSVHSYESAEKLLVDSLNDLGELANLRNLLGLCYHKQSKFSQAIKQFQLALEINSNFIEAALNLSIVYCDLGLYKQGEAAYLDIKSKVPASGKEQLPPLLLGRIANLHCETASYYSKAGLKAEAIKEFEKALSIYPSMPDQIIALAKLEYEVGQLASAKSRLNGFVERFSPSAIVFNLLGLILYQEGDFSAAFNYWSKSQEFDPDDRASRSLIRCMRSTNAHS